MVNDIKSILTHLGNFFPSEAAFLRKYAEYGVTALQFLSILKKTEPINFVGNNWKENEHLPVAVLWGFPQWKRNYVSRFLSDYKTVFVEAWVPWGQVAPKIGDLSLDLNTMFVGWSK